MIKINLLNQRRVRRTAAKGAQTPVMLIAAFVAASAAAIVFFGLHQPLTSSVSELEAKNKDLKDENAALERETANSRAIRDAFESELARQQATQRLVESRVTPAWLLHELANVLTPGKSPQLTPDMQTQLKENPNLPWQEGWDPKNVWITGFEEKGGNFKLQGAAQSKGDVIELGLRLRASMFFARVNPTTTDEVVDKDSGLTYHEFELQGQVRY